MSDTSDSERGGHRVNRHDEPIEHEYDLLSEEELTQLMRDNPLAYDAYIEETVSYNEARGAYVPVDWVETFLINSEYAYQLPTGRNDNSANIYIDWEAYQEDTYAQLDAAGLVNMYGHLYNNFDTAYDVQRFVQDRPEHNKTVMVSPYLFGALNENGKSLDDAAILLDLLRDAYDWAVFGSAQAGTVAEDLVKDYQSATFSVVEQRGATWGEDDLDLHANSYIAAILGDANISVDSIKETLLQDYLISDEDISWAMAQDDPYLKTEQNWLNQYANPVAAFLAVGFNSISGFGDDDRDHLANYTTVPDYVGSSTSGNPINAASRTALLDASGEDIDLYTDRRTIGSSDPVMSRLSNNPYLWGTTYVPELDENNSPILFGMRPSVDRGGSPIPLDADTQLFGDNSIRHVKDPIFGFDLIPDRPSEAVMFYAGTKLFGSASQVLGKAARPLFNLTHQLGLPGSRYAHSLLQRVTTPRTIFRNIRETLEDYVSIAKPRQQQTAGVLDDVLNESVETVMVSPTMGPASPRYIPSARENYVTQDLSQQWLNTISSQSGNWIDDAADTVLNGMYIRGGHGVGGDTMRLRVLASGQANSRGTLDDVIHEMYRRGSKELGITNDVFTRDEIWEIWQRVIIKNEEYMNSYWQHVGVKPGETFTVFRWGNPNQPGASLTTNPNLTYRIGPWSQSANPHYNPGMTQRMKGLVGQGDDATITMQSYQVTTDDIVFATNARPNYTGVEDELIVNPNRFYSPSNTQGTIRMLDPDYNGTMVARLSSLTDDEFDNLFSNMFLRDLNPGGISVRAKSAHISNAAHVDLSGGYNPHQLIQAGLGRGRLGPNDPAWKNLLNLSVKDMQYLQKTHGHWNVIPEQIQNRINYTVAAADRTTKNLASTANTADKNVLTNVWEAWQAKPLSDKVTIGGGGIAGLGATAYGILGGDNNE